MKSQEVFKTLKNFCVFKTPSYGKIWLQEINKLLLNVCGCRYEYNTGS